MTTEPSKEPTDDEIAARIDEQDALVEKFARDADPAALAELIEEVTRAKVASVRVTRPGRVRRAAG